MKTQKEILEYIIESGTCMEPRGNQSFTCDGNVGLPVCPLYDKEYICEGHKAINKSKVTKRQLAQEKLDEILKLEYLENLK